jgi:hypothetical protein|tara:strand:- start:1328 stop:1696 length:369 start_codon:yes stop_codon:yes gene_type:complete
MKILEELIKKRTEIELSSKNHKDALKVLEGLKIEIDRELMEKMDAEGIQLSSANGSFVSIIEEKYPRLVDADAFFDYVRESGDYSLLYKRVGLRAWRECVEVQGNPPGVEESTMKKLNIKIK